MEFVMSSRWSLLVRFEITDGAGSPQFEARAHLGSRLMTGGVRGTIAREVL